MNDRTPSQEFVNNVRKLWNLDKYSVQFLTNDGIWDAMQGDV